MCKLGETIVVIALDILYSKMIMMMIMMMVMMAVARERNAS